MDDHRFFWLLKADLAAMTKREKVAAMFGDASRTRPRAVTGCWSMSAA